MTIHPKLKSLIAVGVLSAYSSMAAAGNDVKPVGPGIHAPEVSAADAKVDFWDMPYLDKPYIDVSPQVRKDNIAVGELGVHGGNKDMIVKLAKDVANQAFGKVDSLLIAQKGKLLFESYYLRGRVDLPHMQASTTKGYLGLAVGRAIALGYLTMADLDKPVASFLKDLNPQKFVAGADKITLGQALTMRSGLRIDREQLRELHKNAEQMKGQGQIQTYFENSPPVTKDAGQFHYQSTDPRMVMQVLDAVVPGSAKDFIKKELLDKLGINQYEWRDDVSGLPMAPYRSSMTSRNMLKWGTLVMNKGKYNGEQLIPQAYIAKLNQRTVKNKPEDTFFVSDNVVNPGYSNYWWLADLKAGNKTYHSISAQGGGGNYIILIEELDLIIVTTAHERNDKTMQLAADRVLPAFI